jgi:hypothetical protein
VIRRGAAVSAGKTILSFRWPVDLRLTVASRGWAYFARWYWDPETGRLGRQEPIGDRLGRIEVAQRDPVSMVVLSQGFDAAALPEIQRRVRRWLSADWEPASAMAALGEDAALIALGGGRLLRC